MMNDKATAKTDIIIADGPEDLAIRGADIFRATARKAVEAKGRFTVVLSGGTTPRPMHRRLGEEPYRSDIPWSQTHVFWGDERCVPVDDPASNYGTAKKDFLDGLPLPRQQIYPMPGGPIPGEGADAYQQTLRAFFNLAPGQVPVFDLIYLGVGADGHTASLFPGDEALKERDRLVAAVRGGDPRLDRLTMTLPVLNRARKVVFSVSGRQKAEILEAVTKKHIEGPPVQRILPDHGTLIWLLDKEAASGLSGGKNGPFVA
jgi:6-phosphogluconolactonase